MNILAVYYSHTGTTQRAMQTAASSLEASGHRVHTECIRPEVDLPPPLWLVQSFFFGATAPILQLRVDPAGFDACLLGLPKWTFACPPINAFLKEYRSRLPTTAVAVTCGGWDQERYLEELLTRMTAMGVTVAAGITLRRREVENQETEAQLAGLVGRLVSAAPSAGPQADVSATHHGTER